jgi:hypothetical protein
MKQRTQHMDNHDSGQCDGRRTRRLPRLLPIALLTIFLAGCGSTGSGGTGYSGDEAAPPSSASVDESLGDAEAGAKPNSSVMGIDTVEWPGDQDGAQEVFDRMPDELGGMGVKRPHFYGPSTGVVYGSANTGITAWVMGPDKEMGDDPQANLSVMFGMGMACEKGTYLGTAAQSRWGGGPDGDRKGEFGPDDGLWWFSCDFEAGESETFTGHAIGWVSGDLGWLVTTPGKDTTRATVAALIDAVE